MDDRRVADYFVVAGLGEGALPLEEVSNEAIIKPSYRQDPITDIVVINRSAGEKVPTNFQCLETTPTGFPANLNHGAIRCSDMFICYRRGRDKPPLKDIGILYEGKERVMEGCEVVHTTPFGRPANVNNSNSSRTYITYRRASETASSDTLVVVDLCVILANKGEEPPLTYNQILKNLNKGMVGSDVYLCYKKAMVKTDVLAYKPTILGRYPTEDYENFPLPESVPMFCLPMGAAIECWSAQAKHPMPSFSTFILTLAGGEKAYGAAVSFYEEYMEGKLTDMQMRALGLKNRTIREQFNIQKTVHVRKAICLLSHWPFFDAFKKFLSQLYKISITGPHSVPIERHISHFMYDVPYPSPQRPRILVQLAHDSLSLCMPEDSPLPQSGASFITLLRNLGPDLCLNLLLYVLLESKILLHSLRPTVLTEVAEAVTSMIFPFHWQCPYIPLCPLGLSDVLFAPCPFIVGIDSRYFDLYDPPPDIVCVDLDTNRISLPEDKKQYSYKMMPKKAARSLLDALHRLFEMSTQVVPIQQNEEVSLEMASVDQDFRRKKKVMQMELLIQEAFLCFMAILLREYKTFLNPIMRQPNNRATDASVLFDMQGFLKSRDKTNAKFYTQMMKTQMFFRFIEERSFVSDKDDSLAFFDDCTEKVDESKEDVRLIEIDNSQASERTVFILPPEPTGLPEGVTYSYNGFPPLKPELFLQKKPSTLSLPGKQPICPNSPLAKRTKQEVKSAQKSAQQHLNQPRHWAKCLLSHCYSLWFISFPAYVHTHSKTVEALKVGFAVLQKMHNAKLPLDQVCYRVLMQLAGQYNKPGLAVQVFSLMKRHGVQPNAITYGYYNKVMLEARWPSPKSKGKLRWTKIRNVIIGVAQFRRAVRHHSMSLYSNSGSECDQISHASVDSYLDDHGDKSSLDTVPVMTISSKTMFNPEMQDTGQDNTTTHLIMSTGESVTDVVVNNSTMTMTHHEDQISTGGASDRGYNTMTHEDVQRMSRLMNAEGESLPSSTPSPTASDLDPPEIHIKPKSESWNPLRFSFRRKKPHFLVDNKTDSGEHPYRSRVGSIVRKSITSFSEQDSMEYLKACVLGNSAGLLMISESFLQHGSFLNSGDLRLEMEQACRRRHKSEGSSGPKPTRSMSLFASWRPKNLLNGDLKILPSLMRFSELSRHEDDVSVSSIQSADCVPHQKTGPAMTTDSDSSSGGTSDVKDSGVGLDENLPSLDLKINGEALREESGQGEGVGKVMDSLTSSVKSGDTNNFHDQSSHATGDVREISTDLSERKIYFDEAAEAGDAVLLQQYCSGQSHDIMVAAALAAANLMPSSEPSAKCNINGDDSVPRSEIVVHSADLSHVEVTSGQSSAEAVAHLADAALANSNPEEVKVLSSSAAHTVADLRTPVQKQNSNPESLQLNTEPRKSSLSDISSDFMIRRTQSLRRTNEVMQKTNEAISGFIKFASKAAYSKFNELKQSITTPIKNATSISSLTRSVDDLDHATEESGGKCDDDDGGSSASGTVKERLQVGSTQDLHSTSESSFTESSAQRLSQTSFGDNSLGSVPSPTYLDSYRSREIRSDSIVSGDGTLLAIATEVEMSSCSRCKRCHCLVFDEEIMAGWSADDSNLNTTCPFCHAKFVPNLYVFVKDWRGQRKPVGLSSTANNQALNFTSSSDQAMLNQNSTIQEGDEGVDGEEIVSLEDSISPGMVSSMHLDEPPLSLKEAAAAVRRRCSSECLANTDTLSINSTDGYYNYYPGGVGAPLNLSVEEDESTDLAVPEMKKDFMTRSSSTAEPLVFPYLSPLVLRKELEYVLDNEGDLCLANQAFLDQHLIIFWNLVWYFRRLEVPSHLSSFLLTAPSFNSPEVLKKFQGQYDSRNVLIRPLWDNVHIHDEMGFPMYLAWSSGHRSTVVDALVTEAESFSRPIMYQIIASIQRNDVLTAIKTIVSGRRRMTGRRRRFRSMYREILFLSFVACGRENIDHDAFDREYSLVFEEKLSAAEVRRLQADDKPRSSHVQWCRRAFCDLEV